MTLSFLKLYCSCFIVISICYFLMLSKNSLHQIFFLWFMALSFALLMSSCSSWFAMIFFLVYVGALMVLFLYICIISSNEMINLQVLKSLPWLVMALLVSSLGLTSGDLFFQHVLVEETASSLLSTSNLSLFVLMVVCLWVVLLVCVNTSSIGSLRVSSN